MIDERAIHKFYSKDPDLINHLHVLAPTTVEKAVQHTIKKIEECKSFGARVWGSDKFYAVIGKHDTCTILYAFFLDVDHRSKSDKDWFLQLLKNNGVTHTCVWDRNIRAKRFFEKNNFKFVRKVFEEEENQEYCIYALNL